MNYETAYSPGSSRVFTDVAVEALPRKDIPRYRRPGSRVVLFDQEELEAWLKRGRVLVQDAFHSDSQATGQQLSNGEISKGVLAIEGDPVYHRNARYR